MHNLGQRPAATGSRRRGQIGGIGRITKGEGHIAAIFFRYMEDGSGLLRLVYGSEN
jgi:hypothetical protein